MPTDSLTAVLELVRERILTFVDPVQGDTIATRLGASAGAAADGRLYLDAAPDGATYPFGVMRLQQLIESGDDGHHGRRGVLEVQYFARPRKNAAALKSIADLTEAAWTNWTDLTSGPVIAGGGLTRSSVFYDGDPADRQVVQERLLLPFWMYPDYVPE